MAAEKQVKKTEEPVGSNKPKKPQSAKSSHHEGSCGEKHKGCPIQEYVNERIEELEHDEATALNPLDRLEARNRLDELQRLVHYMDTRVIKSVLSEIFSNHNEN